MAWEERRFLSFDETPIFYRLLKSEGEPKGIVIIVHGMGEHSGRYLHVGEFFKMLGFATAAYDQRGFGKSGGARGCVKEFSDFHKDLLAFHAYIANQYKKLPIFLLGHSFGGLVASSYLSFCKKLPPAKGLILSSPIFGTSTRVPWWRHWAAVLLSYILPNTVQGTGVLPSQLTHDREILKVYGRDPLIHHGISARLYRELCLMMGKASQIARGLTLPVFLVQAGQDFIVSKEAAIRFYGEIQSPDKTLEIQEETYHEVLNETTRQELLTKLAKWMLERLS